MDSYICLIDPGWAQFFGSIAAIAAGWFYLNKQNRDEINRVRRRDEEARSEKLRVLIPVFSSLYNDLQGTAAKIRAGKLLIELEILRLKSYQHRLMSIPVFDIPDYEMSTSLENIISAIHISQTSLAGMLSLGERKYVEEDRFREAMELPFHIASDSVVRGFISACSAGIKLRPDFISDDLKKVNLFDRSRGKKCLDEYMEYLSSKVGRRDGV